MAELLIKNVLFEEPAITYSYPEQINDTGIIIQE
jgi:hypothetical protein